MAFRQVADDDTRVVDLTSAPVDIEAITLEEVTALDVVYLSDQLLSPLNLDATASDTLPERVLDESSAAQVFTKKNASGELTFVRQFDHTQSDGGQIDIQSDKFQDYKQRGKRGFLTIRRGGKKATDPWEVGDEYDYFEVETDSPRNNSGDGYHKDVVPLTVKRFAKNCFIVSGS